MTETEITHRVREMCGQAFQWCYQYHKCRAGYPILPAMDYGSDRARRLLQFGQWQRVLTSRDVCLCPGYEMRSAHCPKGIEIGEVLIAGIRLVDVTELVWRAVESDREEAA